jgi:hypothetical protein
VPQLSAGPLAGIEERLFMNFFENNVSLYFYSAVLQANTALIAFAAVFVVFRLQQLSQNLQNKETEIIQLIDNHFVRRPMDTPEELKSQYMHIQTLEDALKRLIKDTDPEDRSRSWIMSLSENQSLARLFLERQHFVDRLVDLKRQFKWPMLSILFVILFSLCMLPLSNYMHSSMPCWEYLPILITILLNVWALMINTMFVFKTIKD